MKIELTEEQITNLVETRNILDSIINSASSKNEKETQQTNMPKYVNDKVVNS